MKYIKQTRTGHYHPPYKEEEITREEVIACIGEDALNSILVNKTARAFQASVLQEVNIDLYVGVQF